MYAFEKVQPNYNVQMNISPVAVLYLAILLLTWVSSFLFHSVNSLLN